VLSLIVHSVASMTRSNLIELAVKDDDKSGYSISQYPIVDDK